MPFQKLLTMQVWACLISTERTCMIVTVASLCSQSDCKLGMGCTKLCNTVFNNISVYDYVLLTGGLEGWPNVTLTTLASAESVETLLHSS